MAVATSRKSPHLADVRLPVRSQPTPRDAEVLQITPAAPVSLDPPPHVWRGIGWESFDAVAVRIQRLLSNVGPLRAIHRRSLRRAQMVDVPLSVGPERTGLHGLRIAFLSDLHAGCYCGPRELELLFARTLLLRPDIVTFGGDLVGSRPSDLEVYDGPLQRLTEQVPVLAVPGNHDREWGGAPEHWQRFFEDRGVTMLGNRGARIARGGDSMWLAGVDDYTHGRPDLRGALDGRSAGEPTLMLAHQPDHFDELLGEQIDLVLSGHTHGGQIRICGRAPIHHTKRGYLEGPFQAEGGERGAVGGVSRLHVSRGAGVSLLPLRIGSSVEITMVRVTE